MKNIVIGICSFVLIGILVLTLYTLHGRSIRKQELNQALSIAMENVMDRIREGEPNISQNKDEMVALFLEEFLVQIRSNSDVQVDIIAADPRKGLLSAKAILTYRHPIGTEGKVTAKQTVIIEREEETRNTSCSLVTYMVEGKVYKIYQIKSGTRCTVPVAPKAGERKFLGWREKEGKQVISLEGMRIEEDRTFVAVFE